MFSKTDTISKDFISSQNTKSYTAFFARFSIGQYTKAPNGKG